MFCKPSASRQFCGDCMEVHVRELEGGNTVPPRVINKVRGQGFDLRASDVEPRSYQ